MCKKLEGKVALITGAGRGIGRATAIKMASEGAKIVIAEKDIEPVYSIESELQKDGYDVRAYHADITDEESVAIVVDKALKEFGYINILVNNAGVNYRYNPIKMTSDEWTYAVSYLKGAWLCCKYTVPSMIRNGGGSIINISSIHAKLTTTDYFPYAAVKSALVGMSRSLALDLAQYNIRVNAICPGWVRTRLVMDWIKDQQDPDSIEQKVLEAHPLGRIGTPEEIANFITFVSSDEASFITGADLAIDGGLSIKFTV